MSEHCQLRVIGYVDVTSAEADKKRQGLMADAFNNYMSEERTAEKDERAKVGPREKTQLRLSLHVISREYSD